MSTFDRLCECVCVSVYVCVSVCVYLCVCVCVHTRVITRAVSCTQLLMDLKHATGVVQLYPIPQCINKMDCWIVCLTSDP